MPRVAAHLPAATDMLCESCGYTLNGLPDNANCPECGRPAAESLDANHRQPSSWERSPGIVSFLQTTAAVIFTPSRFFRSVVTRGPMRQAERFGQNHLIIASVLFAVTGVVHMVNFIGVPYGVERNILPFLLLLMVATFATLYFLLRVAARLSAWEAAYRGFRLPLEVVLRGLHYHAAHYLPVSIMAFCTVIGFAIAVQMNPMYWRGFSLTYVYVLSGEVIVGAGYLFNTYWIGMRKMMYANF